MAVFPEGRATEIIAATARPISSVRAMSRGSVTNPYAMARSAVLCLGAGRQHGSLHFSAGLSASAPQT